MSLPSSEPAGAMKLRDIQQAFAKAVMRPLDEDQGMQRVWLDGKPALVMASKFVKPNDRLDSFERLEIYNRQYWFRLINSFYEDFPALRTLIGEDRFYDLTLAYLEKNPSRSFTLRDLGDQLPEFLAAEPAHISPHGQMALDVVALEWAHILAFDSGELPPLETDELLGLDPGKLQIGFQPHLSFLACDSTVDEFVLVIRKQQFNTSETSNAVSEKFSSATATDVPPPHPGKIFLAVHRVNNSVYYKRIDPEAYLICTALQQGETLQAACEAAFERQKDDETFPQTLQSWFSQWSSFGWFCQRQEA